MAGRRTSDGEVEIVKDQNTPNSFMKVILADELLRVFENKLFISIKFCCFNYDEFCNVIK